jgi:hypothetical protein
VSIRGYHPKLTKTDCFRPNTPGVYCTQQLAQVSLDPSGPYRGLPACTPVRADSSQRKMNKTSTKMNTCGGGGCSILSASLMVSGHVGRPGKVVQNEYILSTKGVGGVPFFRANETNPDDLRRSSKSANSPIFADFDHDVPIAYAKSKSAYADFRRLDIEASLVLGVWSLVLFFACPRYVPC